MRNITFLLILFHISTTTSGQIIADHTVVDDFDKIPQYYIDLIKKMWVVIPGESHAEAYRGGLLLLESSNPAFAVSVVNSGTPESYTNSNLRASGATWGDFSNSSGWIYNYGEEDWFTNPTAIVRTKAGIAYSNTHNLPIAAIGFGWCYDMTNDNASSSMDSEYGIHWYGASKNGPEGSLSWGLNAQDYSITGNTVCMDTYLNATQSYINYCTTNGYATKVFFTTGPIDLQSATERQYQRDVKHKYIRDFVAADPARILFDYADILAYSDDGSSNILTWNGHTYPVITNANLGDGSIGHIGPVGAKRLAKAMWWMLARMAGWDGN